MQSPQVFTLSIITSFIGFSVAQVGPFFPITASGAAPVKFTKTYNYDFQHPGILHSHDDLERIRVNVAAGKQPWKSYFDIFANLSSASYSYKMNVPRQNLSRNSITQGTTNGGFEADSTAAYHNALMWYITRDEKYLNKSAEILDNWGTTLKIYDGLDANLGVAEGGMNMVNAAEILRHEAGWVEASMKWQGTSGFSGMVYRVLAPAVAAPGQANYGMASVLALLGIAVFLEDVVMYNYALNEYQNGVCGGLVGTVNPNTGQNSESGRDQGMYIVSLLSVHEPPTNTVHFSTCMGRYRKSCHRQPNSS